MNTKHDAEVTELCAWLDMKIERLKNSPEIRDKNNVHKLKRIRNKMHKLWQENRGKNFVAQL